MFQQSGEEYEAEAIDGEPIVSTLTLDDSVELEVIDAAGVSVGMTSCCSELEVDVAAICILLLVLPAIGVPAFSVGCFALFLFIFDREFSMSIN